METHNITSSEPIENNSISKTTKPKLAKISLILGIVGFIVSCFSLLTIYVFAGASGGLDNPDLPYEVFLLTTYLGFFFGAIGSILGIMGLRRGENKLIGIISIVLGILMLFVCIVLTYQIWVLYLVSLQLR